MKIVTDFTGWPPEKIVSYCHQIIGVRERTPEEWEAYYKAEELKEKRHQEYLKGLYESGDCDVYKKTCPVCGTIFYTRNERRIYDDYYKCSRYQHRESAKMRRQINRAAKCAECGKFFIPKRAGASYCCAACKQKAYRDRKKTMFPK